METAASFEARKAPSSYPTILGEAMETSASFEARSAPLPYPTVAFSETSGPGGKRLTVSDGLRIPLVQRPRLAGSLDRYQYFGYNTFQRPASPPDVYFYHLLRHARPQLCQHITR